MYEATIVATEIASKTYVMHEGEVHASLRDVRLFGASTSRKPKAPAYDHGARRAPKQNGHTGITGPKQNDRARTNARDDDHGTLSGKPSAPKA